MKQPISRIDPMELTLSDQLIYINRVAKVMKGGKRLSFSALVVTGDGNGHVGLGLRIVLEAAGIKDILSKSLGSANRLNVARATMLALSRLKDPKEELAKRRPAEVREATGG